MTTKQAKVVDTVSVSTYQKRKKPNKHYVFQIQVSWNDLTEYYIFRRYSEFYSFHATLLKLFQNDVKKPLNGETLPALPGRILFGRSHVAKVAEARLDAINKYCQSLIRLPTHISESPHVVSFFTGLPGDIKLPPRDWKKQPSLHPLHVPAGNVWETFMVTKDFVGEKDSKQLSLKAGETIQIIRRDDSGWWMGTNGKTAGWVPPSYLSPASHLDDSPDEDSGDSIGLSIPGDKVIETEEYRAIDDFEAEEESQVSFSEGDIVTVVDKEEDGWWFVCVNGKEGWAPFSYLEVEKKDRRREGASSEASEVSEEEDILHTSEETLSKYGRLPEFVTIKEYIATESDELSVPAGVNVQVVKKSITGWWSIKYDGKLGLFPSIYLREAGANVSNTRGSFHTQRQLVPRKKTIIRKKTMRMQRVLHKSKSSPESPASSIDQTSSSDERELSSYKNHSNRYSRSRSPVRPPRPRQTLINHALTPNLTPNLSPAVSPMHFATTTTASTSDPPSRAPLHESMPVHKTSSDSDSLSSSCTSSPTARRSSSPQTANGRPHSPSGDKVLVDALLKVILQSGSTEMKASLTDMMIENPSLAGRLKAAKKA